MTTSLGTSRDRGRAWQERRAWWGARLPYPCSICGLPVERDQAWHLHHPLPLVHGGQDSEARPAHAACNLAAGAQLGFFDGPPPPGDGPSPTSLPVAGDSPRSEPEPEPITPGPADSAWDGAAWLREIRDVPQSARWPRVMSALNPRAVGSYGPELITWADGLGWPLRWWQKLLVLRVLEHDEQGELVWLGWTASTSRQVGKSWVLRVLLLWRIHQADLFGEPQLALHTGKDLNVCHEVQRPARTWARVRKDDGYRVREANGQQEIEAPDGSRWMIRGRDSLYGYSASLAVVDEAWHVAPNVVEDGLEPTMAERRSPQLGLISTAHRLATSLVPTRRAAAILTLAEPTDQLILEWSALPDAELDEREAWFAASPHWSERRARLLEAAYIRALAGGISDDPDEPDPREAFRSQWLNIWPTRLVRRGADEPLLEDGAWAARRDLNAQAVGPLVLGLEDYFGQGAAAAAAGKLPDGRILVWGVLAARRSGAIDWLALTAARHPGSALVLGASLATDPAVSRVPTSKVDTAGVSDLRVALPLFRELVGAGRLVHDGGEDLATQVERARVVAGPAGLGLYRGGYRADLLRAAAWAVSKLVATPEPEPAPRFVIR